MALLALALAVSAQALAPAPSPALQLAQAQFKLASEVCAVAGPIEPASPPFSGSELKRFELSQDRLRLRCKDLNPIAGGLDALKALLEPEDLAQTKEAGQALDQSYKLLRKSWQGLVDQPKDRRLAGQVVESMHLTEKGLDLTLRSLEVSFQRALHRIGSRGSAPAAKPKKPDFSK